MSTGEPITREALRRKLQGDDAGDKLQGVDRSTEENRIGRVGTDQELEEWARQHNYRITNFVYENGVPGQTPILLRTDFVAAINNAANDPEYAGVIIPSTARLGRDTDAFKTAQHAMMWAGKHLYVGTRDHTGHLITVRDAAAEETLQERLERQIEELEAHIHRLAWSIEGHRGRRAVMANGGWGGGTHKPKWFQEFGDAGGRRAFTVNRQRLQWAFWIHERKAEGWSWQTIANELNRHGVLYSGHPFGLHDVRAVHKQLANTPDWLLQIWLDTGYGPAQGAVAGEAEVTPC